MAKKCYYGVLSGNTSIAKNVKEIYIGVASGNTSVAKKVLKGYVGDSQGKARLFWDGAKWRREADIPYNFYQGAAVVYQGKVHLLGGVDYPTRHYSWDGTTWAEESTLPYNLTLGSAVVWNNKIHILGSSSAYSAHYSWDGSTWTQEANTPHTFYGENNAVIYDGYIHAVSSLWGSYSQHRYIAKYDGSAWTTVLNPTNQLYTSSATYNGKIYLLGGSGTGGQTYQTYDGTSFDGSGNIPYQYYNGFAVVYNGKIHLLGSSQRYTRQNHYGFDGTDFENKSTMPYEFYYCPAVVYRGRIHIFGGETHKTEHWSYGENVGAIFSNLYPKADVNKAGIITENNGSRSPVTKQYDGDSVCFAVRNGQGSAYGGNWIVTFCVALSRDAAIINQPGTGTGVGSYTINGVTYYFCLQSSNPNWGGATQVSSPHDIPIFDNWYICEPNGSIPQSKIEEIIERLGIEVTT